MNSPFQVGDRVVFYWCKGKISEYLIGQTATVIEVLPTEVRVFFDNGETHEFYSDRFKLFVDKNRLLTKIKQMYERQPYVKGNNHARTI